MAKKNKDKPKEGASKSKKANPNEYYAFLHAAYPKRNIYFFGDTKMQAEVSTDPKDGMFGMACGVSLPDRGMGVPIKYEYYSESEAIKSGLELIRQYLYAEKSDIEKYFESFTKKGMGASYLRRVQNLLEEVESELEKQVVQPSLF